MSLLWKCLTLADVGNIVSGGTPSTKIASYWNGNTPWITPADLSRYSEKFISGGKKFITDEGLINSSAKLMPSGTVLFSSRAPIGYVAIAKSAVCTNQGFKSIVPDTNIINSEFLYYYLRFAKNLAEDAASGTTFKEISSKKFSKIPIPVPELDIQKKIVFKIEGLFSEIDFGLERLKKVQLKLEHYKQSILNAAIRGKLVPQDPSDEPASVLLEKIRAEKAALIKAGKLKKEKPLPPIDPSEVPFELPKDWEWVRLGDVTNYGQVEKAKNHEINENTWVLELEDIEKETSNLLKKVLYGERRFKSEKNKFHKGNVLYGKLRPYLDKVIIAQSDGVCTSEIIPINSYGLINSNYILIFLKSLYFINYANNVSHGVNLPRLGTEAARLALLPLPPMNEQKRIVDFAQNSLEAAKKSSNEVFKQQEIIFSLKQSILKQAFSGKLL